MILPIRTDSPLRNTPYMNWLIILANALVFAWETARPNSFGKFELSPHSPALIQFFTYQFLHANVMHIVGNMLFLYIFGNNVNDKMGHLGYLAFYLGAGVFAGVCYVVTQHTGAHVLGASGAIAGVTGAYLILFPRSHITIVYFFIIIGAFELQSLWFIALFFAQDVILNFSGETNVAHMAHIGGTLFGAVVCLILLASHLLPRDQFDVWALLQRWNKRRQYRDLVSKGYNPFDPAQGDRENKRMPNPSAERIMGMRAQISDALSRREPMAAADLYLQLKSIDPSQVMARQSQLDIATQLHHDARYPEAAEAYEQLLKVYPNVEHAGRVELMVGLIYARYLNRFDLAKQHLLKAIDRLHSGREADLAKEELSQIESHSARG